MSYTIRPDSQTRRVHVRVFGAGSAAEARQLITELGARIDCPPEFPVLMDIRELEYVLAPREVEDIAERHAGPFGLGTRRVAVLAKPGVLFGVARQIAMLTEFRGSTIEVFTDPDHAEQWLRSQATRNGP
jgi:hypothetical protein